MERTNTFIIVETYTVVTLGIIVSGTIRYMSRSPLLLIQGTLMEQHFISDICLSSCLSPPETALWCSFLVRECLSTQTTHVYGLLTSCCVWTLWSFPNGTCVWLTCTLILPKLWFARFQGSFKIAVWWFAEGEGITAVWLCTEVLVSRCEGVPHCPGSVSVLLTLHLIEYYITVIK